MLRTAHLTPCFQTHFIARSQVRSHVRAPVRSQDALQTPLRRSPDAHKYAPNCTRWHTPRLLDCTLPSMLPIALDCTLPSRLPSRLPSTFPTMLNCTLPSSLDYTLPSTLLCARCRETRGVEGARRRAGCGR